MSKHCINIVFGRQSFLKLQILTSGRDDDDHLNRFQTVVQIPFPFYKAFAHLS